MADPDGSFFDGIEQLRAQVGHGLLEGAVEVDQLYAQYQHEGLDFNHPRGGQALYLGGPLTASQNSYMQKIADTLLDDVDAGMKDVVEDLSAQVGRLAPIDLNNLRRSAHPTVTDDGDVVYDRPPDQPRLSEDELRALRHGHPHP